MTEQRRNQRFDLKLPIELLRAGTDSLPQVGETKNMSSCGVLFTSEKGLPEGSSIEYLVTLPNGTEEPALRLRCMGKVVRTESRASDPVRYPFAVAATLERHEFVRK
ncbi:MAG: PilZ domain-containing protein [Acidobacteria bacterium]|nr:PilZ domain-containing protein [Acidobacteriota bacterium]